MMMLMMVMITIKVMVMVTAMVASNCQFADHVETWCSHVVDQAKTRVGLRLVYSVHIPGILVLCHLDANGGC